ncbi:uncharacterized protein LOC6545125 [Drosophila erecta]|uniref:Uncharacterized protein n=1 Tax=Drosophila erecta TaxID=7220 RepID=B3NJD5_DROER|nr:uncharacterized protein LOC6545125 [Drosophila erecta]EDV50097.1 uncharacterized protein Dere_GG14747 [Drosophila erecta]
MRFIGSGFIAFCCLVAFPTATPVLLAPIRPYGQNGTLALQNNFSLELRAVIRQIPVNNIEKLVQTYLLNDIEFQALIRAINSLPAYRFYRQLINQPEVRQLQQWIVQQLILSGGGPKIFDSLELEVKIFNKYPYWSQIVSGIQGFQAEFVQIYPVQLIRSLLEPSATQTSPLLSELWRRLVALRPVYERVLATPSGKLITAELQRLRVDVGGVDALIRYQFGWSNATFSSYDYMEYLY